MQEVNKKFFHNEKVLIEYVQALINISMKIPDEYFREIGDDNDPMQKLKNYENVSTILAQSILKMINLKNNLMLTLKSKVVSGFKWLSFLQFFRYFVDFILIVITARLINQIILELPLHSQ